MEARVGHARAHHLELHLARPQEGFALLGSHVHGQAVPEQEALLAQEPSPQILALAVSKAQNEMRDVIQDLCDRSNMEQWNDWYRRILIKDLRCGVTHKTINKHSEMKVPVFECMLADDSKKHEKKMTGEKPYKKLKTKLAAKK